MLKNRLPSEVPLPEVGEYTDSFSISQLGLPSGLDQEQLLFNVRGVERIRLAGVLGEVSVTTDRRELSSSGLQASSVDASGVATLARVAFRRVDRLSNNSYQSYDDSIGPDVVIGINNTAIEARLRENSDRHDRSLVNPSAWAKYLNQSIKRGLIEASGHGFFDGEWPSPILMASLYVTLLVGGGDLTNLRDALIGTEGLTQAFIAGAIAHYAMRFPNKGLKGLKEAPYSVTPFLPIDRYLATVGLTKATRLVRARG